LAEDCKQELEQTQRTLRELSMLIQQSTGEVEKLAQRHAQSTNKVRQIQANIDTWPRDDIRAAYEALQDAQQRLFTMRGQLEKLQSDRQHLERYAQLLQRVLSIAEQQQAPTPRGLTAPLTPIQTDGLPVIMRIVEAQEIERQRLTRAMHDGPAQSLTNFILQAEICQRLFDADPARARSELVGLKNAAMTTFQKIKSFMFELRPMMLDDLGLAPTVRRYVEAFGEKSGITSTLTITGTERRLAPYSEVTLFRAIQELLTNVRQHAQATNVRVQLDMDGQTVRAVVEDDGTGFETGPTLAAAAQRRTIGLSTMKERIEMLDGHFEVESSPGNGTRVTVELPATEAEVIRIA
jgi:two-component system sensor histidine kinase DegS